MVLLTNYQGHLCPGCGCGVGRQRSVSVWRTALQRGDVHHIENEREQQERRAEPEDSVRVRDSRKQPRRPDADQREERVVTREWPYAKADHASDGGKAESDRRTELEEIAHDYGTAWTAFQCSPFARVWPLGLGAPGTGERSGRRVRRRGRTAVIFVR